MFREGPLPLQQDLVHWSRAVKGRSWLTSLPVDSSTTTTATSPLGVASEAIVREIAVLVRTGINGD